MLWSNLTKTLLFVSVVCYFGHSYWHNTMDFTRYKERISLPAANPVLKYLYMHSFFLFVISGALLLGSAVADVLESRSPTVRWSLFAASVLLGITAACILPRPRLETWPRRDAP